jgi:hypothetical protein
VREEVRAAGGVGRRERVGHAFIKKTMSDTRAVFGGELSGHFYFRDNYNADSGAIVLAVTASVVSEQDRPMSELIAPLKRYVQSGEPMDKAGSYAIQGLGAIFVDRVVGCFHNVIGLPLALLSRMLLGVGVDLLDLGLRDARADLNRGI